LLGGIGYLKITPINFLCIVCLIPRCYNIVVAPIAQRTERGSPKAEIRVRIPVGALKNLKANIKIPLSKFYIFDIIRLSNGWVPPSPGRSAIIDW
jgi:hypothetical protein